MNNILTTKQEIITKVLSFILPAPIGSYVMLSLFGTFIADFNGTSYGTKFGIYSYSLLWLLLLIGIYYFLFKLIPKIYIKNLNLFYLGFGIIASFVLFFSISSIPGNEVFFNFLESTFNSYVSLFNF